MGTRLDSTGISTIKGKCFIYQYLYLHKDKTMSNAIAEWICYINNMKDNYKFIGSKYDWFVNPDDHSDKYMVDLMKPILEDCFSRKDFIGENGKYNK